MPTPTHTPRRGRRSRVQPGDPSTAVAYTRVSTAGQAESGLGLEAQRHAIRDYAARAGLTVTTWHEDAGISGAKMSNRPGLLAALDAIATGQAGTLITDKIDRLGRSMADVSVLVERAQRDGWRLASLDVGLDTATPSGALVVHMLAAAARFEWQRISERQRAKFTELRRRGTARGRAAAPRALADRLLKVRARGWTFQRIADQLNAKREPTIRGGKLWKAATVRSVIVTRERELAAQAA